MTTGTVFYNTSNWRLAELVTSLDKKAPDGGAVVWFFFILWRTQSLTASDETTYC